MNENRFKIAVVVALEREVRPFIRGWRVSEREYEGRRFRFFEQDEVVVVCGGIGAGAARRAAAALIALYAPRIVFSAGFAGALGPELNVGDVVCPSQVINAEDGSSTRIPGGEGVLVSFGSVANPEQKVKLRESYAAQAVDMEAAAVARAAEARGVEFRAIKVISDPHDFVFPAMEKFVDPNGRFLEAKFALFSAVRPWLWLQVGRLMRNSKLASQMLCGWLRTNVELRSSGQPGTAVPTHDSAR
jgi:adenosylhomocysteine nucleosidase